jgi:hypothetical protein
MWRACGDVAGMCWMTWRASGDVAGTRWMMWRVSGDVAGTWWMTWRVSGDVEGMQWMAWRVAYARLYLGENQRPRLQQPPVCHHRGHQRRACRCARECRHQPRCHQTTLQLLAVVATAVFAIAGNQGLPIVHFSAKREHVLWVASVTRPAQAELRGAHTHPFFSLPLAHFLGYLGWFQ